MMEKDFLMPISMWRTVKQQLNQVMFRKNIPMTRTSICWCGRCRFTMISKIEENLLRRMMIELLKKGSVINLREKSKNVKGYHCDVCIFVKETESDDSDEDPVEVVEPAHSPVVSCFSLKVVPKSGGFYIC